MRSGKLQKLLDIIKKLYTAPEEIKRLETMLAAENEDALRALIEEEPDLADEAMKNLVSELIEEGKAQNSISAEVMEKLEMIRRSSAVRPMRS